MSFARFILVIVRSLRRIKSSPPRPVRTCRKSTGLPSSRSISESADRADCHCRYSHQRYDHEIKQALSPVSRAVDADIRAQTLTKERLEEIAHNINAISSPHSLYMARNCVL